MVCLLVVPIMSVRGNPDGTTTPIVDAVVPKPTPPEYEIHKEADPIKIYPTHNGVKRHVPLCESSKSNIMRAVMNSDPARLADLLDDPNEKALIDHLEWQGFHALHFTCQTTTTGTRYGLADHDCIACGKMLIDAGCNVNVHAREGQGYTPLMFAAMSHYPAVEMCRYLIDAGADLFALDDYGGTALHATAYGSKVEQLKVLRTHPDFEKALAIKNNDGLTALDVAIDIYKKQKEKVQLAPCHCEVRCLLATGKGFPGPDEGKDIKAVDHTPNPEWYPPGTLHPASLIDDSE